MSAFKNLGFGLGLRSPHYAEILAGRTRAEWFEALTENYLGISTQEGSGQPLRVLLKIRERFPVTLHGVSLSIGSTAPLDALYLKKVKALSDQIQPEWVSDHLCWTGVHGKNTHDLLPLPYNEETLTHVASRIQKVQETWRRPLVLENVSSYVEFQDSTLTEWEFIRELVKRTGCKLLLDLNNIYVSSVNHGFNPKTYVDHLPLESVVQIHLAGGKEKNGMIIDTHDHPVPEPVWNLYSSVLPRLGSTTTMIEWDANIPELSRVEEELDRARTFFSPQASVKIRELRPSSRSAP